MYIRKKYSKRSTHPTMQIVEGYRVGKKVKQRTIASLGVVKDEADLKRLEGLAKSLIYRLEKEGFSFDDNRIQLEDIKHLSTEYNGFRLVTEKLLNRIGFSKVLHSAPGKHTFDLHEIITLLVSSRIHLPSSKLRSFERQEDYGCFDIDLQHIYRSMDVIHPLKDEFQKQAFTAAHKGIFKDPVDCLFFDVTTLYFESVAQDELKDFGFSKDQKHHSVQIVLALVVNREGIPLAYETFKGNMSETKTLIPVLKKMKTQFAIKNITVVCDRGLSSKNNVNALWESELNFVIACKLRQLPENLEVNNLYKFRPL